MSWKIKEKYRSILTAERGACVKNHGGKISVCLVYPNHYRTGMSNLGFQTVYAQLNSHDDVVCERAFLPESSERAEYLKSRTSLLSLESQRLVADFDVIAFSVSFESDYLNIPPLLNLAGVPPLAADRDASHPLVMMGGAAAFLNPEPVADFFDMVAVGESESLLPSLLRLLRQEHEGRRALLVAAAGLPGVYVPSHYEVVYDGAAVSAITPRDGAPSVVDRQWEQGLNGEVTASVILTEGTEFSDMHLVEVSRGCPRGCRFCAAGFIYHPYRQRPVERIKEEVARGLEHRQKVGLVGAAVSDYRDIGALSRHILDQGGKVSVSSLRIDGLDEEMIEVLKESGHRTVALAPEGGSQRLRDLVGKNISEEQILAACDRLIGKDILNLKLYFIIGLPTETMADLEEMTGLVKRIRERVIEAARRNRRLGEVVLSVNPFVPKPFTPFQWCPMDDQKSLERKAHYLQQAVRPLSNVSMHVESLREAYLQALLSRGDRRLSRLLLETTASGSWKRAARTIGFDTDSFVYRAIPCTEILPWDIIGGSDRSRLLREFHRAFGEETNTFHSP